jgi:hypothetical protein
MLPISETAGKSVFRQRGGDPIWNGLALRRAGGTRQFQSGGTEYHLRKIVDRFNGLTWASCCSQSVHL